ncbi:rhodanese-related sulfurtransferase [Williamsia muralis]|uniref:Rhodanese-related sulfurtransferase n=1 Tax=Williamsia marianensis TaxID=85044 RepID=A0A495K5N9_WILMA|nr:rhodanese-like domain-containing protein [Williamsia muralis]RKR95938.1 rhodanese-related sulfurtransferase [Williamsia muralis]
MSPVAMADPISAQEAAEHRDRGEAVVVDMRPQVVRHQGSLPGAVVVEPSELATAFSPDSDKRIPAIRGLDTEIDVVSVNSQAARIAQQIAAMGYTNVHYVDGGFRALQSALPR